jgi:crossover junction endodeoxyribonuclease RuvC
MVILGIDPGTAVTGYGAIAVHNNTVRWLDSGVIRTDQAASLAAKLEQIYDRLLAIMAEHTPRTVCVEQAFYAKNVHTTLILGHARGVAMLAGAKVGADIEEYSPREIKKSIVGSGAATKQQVAYMVHFMLRPPKERLQPDASDALAVALCGFTHQKAKAALARAVGAERPRKAGRYD